MKEYSKLVDGEEEEGIKGKNQNAYNDTYNESGEASGPRTEP